MDITKTLKEELDDKIKKLENFIGSKGVGSGRLTKAKKMQRNVNLAIFLGAIATFAGVFILAFKRNDS
jgi:hypothetical protein